MLKVEIITCIKDWLGHYPKVILCLIYRVNLLDQLACHVWRLYLFLSTLKIFLFSITLFFLFYIFFNFILFNIFTTWEIGHLDHIWWPLWEEIFEWRGLFPICTKLSRPPSNSPPTMHFFHTPLLRFFSLLVPLATSSICLKYAFTTPRTPV